jgi:hypothetical protein
MEITAALLFALAILHTFSTAAFERLAHAQPRHAGLWHLLGEVEVVFGIWAALLLVAMAVLQGPTSALVYAESRSFAEPMFVFVIMVVAGSRPVLEAVRAAITTLACRLPLPLPLSQTWLCLALVPLAGSFVTEPAAMTLAALMLAPSVFRPEMPARPKYAVLGVLFVNVSVGGTLSSFAAPPVLMVAHTWHWDSAYMVAQFGWKAALAVVINATGVTLLLRRHLRAAPPAAAAATASPVPPLVTAIHLAFLAGVVAAAHHPVIFLGLFLLFLGFARAYERHQSPLILREALLVAFFLAGLVVLGGLQTWWLQPLVAGLPPTALFFGTLGLTAVTDNAALTYLGSLMVDLPEPSRYLLVAGAVAGGGLTVIANAPNPAGIALLRRGFDQETIGAGELLAAALAPTAVAALLFLA